MAANDAAVPPPELSQPEAGPSTSSTSAAPVNADGEAPTLSKNQQKKAAKRARAQEHKLEKRAQERARRRERQAELSKGLREGTLTTAELEQVEKSRELKRARKAASKGKEENVWPGAIVIDLGFDSLMLDGEITSMVSQLTYVYAANRTAKFPVSSVLHTSFSPESSPRLWEKLGRAQWHRWNRMHFWAGGVDTLSATMKEHVEKEQDPAPQKKPGEVASVEDLSDPHLPFPASRQLVYLSADAEEELTTLSEDEVYIIGGIVDRNRHKNLCQGKAEGLGIRTARLPIGSFIENLPTRKVLTVNQVYEILLNYLALQDWKAAFEAVIPQRKYFHGRDEKKAANSARRVGDGTSEAGTSAAGTSVAGEGEGVETEECKVDDMLVDEEAAMNA
ncbi:hypothetical protein CC85DRAFT_312434 [Cutaneotrichosporon oleaginosum]|uniref:tRNA (guanine(9)-N1)-methyltransferase n=1 Tax=Cutaneotrichosporon oleaginosum TaxID=879819 RepID=A0A0J0XLV3_9TREE|nr:uncharacterized protein CC85DRAFT_312434 [Cutaneotrichosporon oleaginosum]KLT42096.1 hypothetical protein CC85DRAFT_312434 [Cutaneotrichosporon oleaginosum]TXT04665.1 hypothetical protein COLE_07484 [Cutaneotrichosporon oleaginosum]